MKRCCISFIVLFLISLFGCNTITTHSGSGTVYGDGSVEQNQTVDGHDVKTDVNADFLNTGNPGASSSTSALMQFPMTAGYLWPSSIISVTEGAMYNEIIVNSTGRLRDADGITFSGLTSLRGKTIILYFANSGASNFNRARMLKLGTSDKKALVPLNTLLVDDEYIPAQNTEPGRGIEFVIPDDFDGQLDFIFYQAILNDLKITAYYK